MATCEGGCYSIINSLLYNVCSMKNVLIKLEYFYDFLLNQGSEWNY